MLPAAHHGEVCKVSSSYRAGTGLSLHSLILVYSECEQKSRCSFGVSRIYTAYFSQFDFGVYSLISVCTYQIAELDLFFTIPFVGIRIISALMCHFAVSKTDEILSLSTGDQNKRNTTKTTNKPNTTIKEARGWVFSGFVSLPL